MFGKKGRFEKDRTRGEAGRAPATILRVSELLPGVSSAAGPAIGGTYRVQVRVEPVGEPAFEASLTMHMTDVSFAPRVGSRIPVIHHGGSVAWDSDEARAEFGHHAGSRLDLEDEERDRFRTTLLSRLDAAHAAGKIDASEHAARRAEIEADPQLRPVSGS
jgi:hypothetical protein